MNIFSSFDPSLFSIYYKNLAIIIIPLILLTTNFWLNPSSLITWNRQLKLYIISQLKKTKLIHLKRLLLITRSTFIIIIYINIIGLLPYLFRPSRHIVITLSLGLPLWILLIIRSLKLSTKKTIGHLLPDRAPLWLNPFLIIIESIRIIVRPLTLSFRLAANITAGHIILCLLSTFSSTTTIIPFISLIIISTIYTIFELGICLIQAYIFCLLVSLYRNDHS